ncbi:MAG TPA: STAS domain-containing protein [Chroococcales cyanobacterium]
MGAKDKSGGKSADKHVSEKHGTEKHETEKHGTEKHGTEKHGTEKHETEKHEAEKHWTEKHESEKHAKGAAKEAMKNRASEVQHIVGTLERSLDHIDSALASDKDLTLDFTACTFITVEGLEWLEELMFRAQSKGSSIRFVNLKPPVYKVFKVAHIDSLLQACGAPGAPSSPVC